MSERAKHSNWVRTLKKAKGLQIEEPKEEPFPQNLLWVWDAFCILSRCRLTNQTGPQPIQVSEVDAYCDLTGIEHPNDLDDLLFFVTELDIVWLKRTHAKIAREREKAARKNTRSR